MTKEEIRGIWNLLGTYRPGDKRLKDKELMTAWWITFEPYGAEEVRQAVISHFRRKRFVPDIKESTDLLPPLPGLGPDATRPQRDIRAGGRAREETEALQARWLALRKRRRELGVPETVAQARDRGMSWREWWTALEKGGMELV